MVLLEFEVNKEKDIKIWLRFLKSNKDSYGLNFVGLLPKDILDRLLNKPEEEQKQVISSYTEQFYTKEYLDRFSIDSYNKVKEKLNLIIERLETIHNRKLPVERIIVIYDTFTACPYVYQGKKSKTYGLYFNNLVIDNNIQINVFSHELMHLFFHYYYFDDCLKKGLTEDQAMDLKEAVTVLLNLEFKDLIEKKDNGYPNHQKIRQIISEEWQKQEEKDFLKLLDLAIEKIKSQDI